MKAIGLMSGTSCDGITACISDLALSNGKIESRLISWRNYDYEQELRSRLLECCKGEGISTAEVCHLNYAVAHAFANAAIELSMESGVGLDSIDFVASHGQTVWHDPCGRVPSSLAERPIPATLQLGEPSIIAERTGLTVVSDFRARDIAAGGQGAPLVPFADLMMFSRQDCGRVIQNIGGIANLTYLPAGTRVEDIVAFDTGPGNMVIDRIVQRGTAGRLLYDVGGDIASRGSVIQKLLEKLMQHPYFAISPPKTTGREDFGHPFADNLFDRAIAQGTKFEDLVATVTEWTAASIYEACLRYVVPKGGFSEMIVCGGGAYNRAIIRSLKKRLAPVAQVITMDDAGFPSHAKEAHSFAILGFATLHSIPSNVPAATGAKKHVILGNITPGRNFRPSLLQRLH